MCVHILRSIGTKIDEFRKHAKIGGLGILLIGISIRNILHFYDVRFKSFGSSSGFHVVGDLDLDLYLCSIFCHTYWA